MSYANKGDVTHHGVKLKGGSLSNLIWASGGVDMLIALAILMMARVLCFYFEMRHKIIVKKLEIKLLAMKEKEGNE